MDSLRTETVEDVKILSQLNRLKITLVAGIASVAFGLAPSMKSGDLSPLLLCLTPLICLYCDCQYYHHLAKIFARAAFMRRHPEEMSQVQEQYEKFMREIRLRISPKLFSFETTVQLGSSLVLSLSVPALGIANIYLGNNKLSHFQKQIMVSCLISSISLGIILTAIYYYRYSNSLKMLRDDEERILENNEANLTS